MAHFAQLDSNNKVIRISIVSNDRLLDSNGVEQESLGIARLQRLHGRSTRWKQTSYNATIRKNYAGIGYTYDESLDAFVPPKPEGFDSWVLDEVSCQWKAPIDPPLDIPAEFLIWFESTTTWKDSRMLVPQRDFLRRITPDEWKDIEESEDPVVMYFRTMALVENKPIDTESPEADTALTHMESTGKRGGGAIFASGRKDQILAPPA